MGNKESFNKGVETGIRIAEGIVKKEVEAMTYLENKIDTMSSMQEEVRSVVNGILEYQNSEAIEKYYGICNMLNPRDLEDAEKTVLLNVLATLACKLKDDYTNNQKRYYLNLKRYISLANFVPDTNYSFGLVENIRDLDCQEIIMKCVREFLFLENNDFSFEEKYSELFELFSINKKTIKKIDLWIDITYTLLTENGIVEMYGLHEMENIELENTEVLNLKMEDLFIEQSFTIEENEEKIIENKFVHFNAKIECKGKFILRNCKVFYFEKNNEGICFSEGSKLEIVNCVVVDGGIKRESYFADGRKWGEDNGDVLLKNSIIENCSNFVRCNNIQMIDCEIINCMFLISASNKGNNSIVEKCYILTKYVPEFAWPSNSSLELWKIYKCILHENLMINEVTNDRIYYGGYYYGRSGEYQEICNCTLIGINASIISNKVLNCRFINCTECVRGDGYVVANVSECYFEKCSNCIGGGTVIDCQFLNCKGNMISGSRIDVRKCQFLNCTAGGGAGTDMIYSYVDEAACLIYDCLFDGIELCHPYTYAISVRGEKKCKPTRMLKVEKCKFKNCVKDMSKNNEGIIRTKYKYGGDYRVKALNSKIISATNKFRTRETTGCTIYSCEGLDNLNLEGKVCKQYEIKTKDSFGNNIGSNDSVKRGISGEVANYIYQIDFAV